MFEVVENRTMVGQLEAVDPDITGAGVFEVVERNRTMFEATGRAVDGQAD